MDTLANSATVSLLSHLRYRRRRRAWADSGQDLRPRPRTSHKKQDTNKHKISMISAATFDVVSALVLKAASGETCAATVTGDAC